MMIITMKTMTVMVYNNDENSRALFALITDDFAYMTYCFQLLKYGFIFLEICCESQVIKIFLG